MTEFRFNRVHIESFAINTPTTVLTSSELEAQVATVYERLGIPFGTLERVSGIKNRFVWGPEVAPSQVGTVAATRALEQISFSRDKIGAIFSCSVCRDFFEPATACLIHKNLGFSENVMAMDITNACLGFSNGLTLMANMIEHGVIEAGIVVSGENPASILESNSRKLLSDSSITRDQLLKLVPTFTLGCGGVAYVLCNEKLARSSKKIMGAVSSSATEHADLCAGNGDFAVATGEEISPIMETESGKLIAAAAKLGGRAWQQASPVLGWKKEDISHVICHQVGRQVNSAFYEEMGLDYSKDFAIWRDYGNLISAAMPTALVIAEKERPIKEGEKVLLTAFGSGLHAIFTGVTW